MPIELVGEHTTARIMVEDESLVGEGLLEQVREFVDHPAFTEPVRVMPDGHWGMGAPVGFTMPLPEQVVPNVIGVDIGCFTGDTEVPLVDGEDHRLDELADRNDSFVVFSCKPDGEIVCAEATAHQTRKDAPLLEVELDNGEPIRCTPDHEFMLRDGTYREARKLSSGDSLMPLYQYETDDGYTMVNQNKDGQSSQRVHWIVARSGLMGEIPSFGDERTVIHHENFGKSDNRPENLRFLSDSDHAGLHRELASGEHWQSEEFERKRIQAIKQRAQTEEAQKRMAEVGRENIVSYMQENPDEWYEKVSDNGQHGKEHLIEWNKSEEAREKARERANQRYECEFCSESVKSYIGLHNHKSNEHPEEYDAASEPDQFECGFCGRIIKGRVGTFQHQRHTHSDQYTENKEHFTRVAGENHEVTAVRQTDHREDVYCLNVPQYHNFALSAGVFVHNCGMAVANLGPELPLADAERERRVREAVPMGRSVHDHDDAVHLIEAFPFDRANERLAAFDAAHRERFGEPVDPRFDFDGYDGDYFKRLCERVLADQRQGLSYVIRSAGTLGGGNHFIEFCRGRESGDRYLVVHSGSRYLGKAVAEFWQGRATAYRNADRIRERLRPDDARFLKFDPEAVSDADLFRWVTGGMGESHIHKDRVREECEGTTIERTFDRLGDLRPPTGDEGRNTALDPLVGREAHGYYVDMLFAQQYARWNRELMVGAVCDALGVDPVETWQSVHNYIDFRDLTVRKGATPAREDQRLLVPFNMAEGAVIACGTGNEAWLSTAPHGAGRRMGRRDAHERLSMAEFEAAMDGVYSESVVDDTLDEAPGAYKPAAAIERALAPTADVVERLDPVHNLKALE